MFLNFLLHHFTPCCQALLKHEALCNTSTVLFKPARSGNVFNTFGVTVTSSVELLLQISGALFLSTPRTSSIPSLSQFWLHDKSVINIFRHRPRTFCLKRIFCPRPIPHILLLNATMWSLWTRWDGEAITWWRSVWNRWRKGLITWSASAHDRHASDGVRHMLGPAGNSLQLNRLGKSHTFRVIYEPLTQH